MKLGKTLISEHEIQHRTSQLAHQIVNDFKDDEILIISVLKGAFMFTADLIRRISKLDAKIEIDFIRARSYGSGKDSSGVVKLDLDVSADLKNRCVLLVDDIVDSGNTLKQVCEYLNGKGAAKVSTCVLLDKPARRTTDFVPDYIGFEIPDYFVVGYGLDYNERGRCLPFITHIVD